MGWFLLAKLFSALISLVRLGRLSETEKNLEILLLRQQISILLRNRDHPVYATRIERLNGARATLSCKKAGVPIRVDFLAL